VTEGKKVGDIMSNFNQVILMGNLTREPNLNYTSNQTPVVEFGLAVNRTFKKQDGSTGEDVCFVDCKSYGAIAETINKYMKKGSPLFVVGRLHLETWEQDGQRHARLRVIVERFQFIGGAGNEKNNKKSRR
jgi:single-strand DNA-binding protein